MEIPNCENYDLILLTHMEEIKEISRERICEDNLELALEVFCKICDNLVQMPTSCKKCQNIFCKKCIDQWEAKNFSCPIKHDNKYEIFQPQEISKTAKNIISKIKAYVFQMKIAQPASKKTTKGAFYSFPVRRYSQVHIINKILHYSAITYIIP